ncbi:hypothetical protein [Sphingomonas bacterium]|uniref:hypothetical protein n=1 Tax=Sphingomonas bacterium TaxID=1895847 RepID=UPI0026326DBC|nr:hypothetical protein [Sphingomonas bacterium]MDB5677097.1 hypothetical protein [Sphingomonas bacterium]
MPADPPVLPFADLVLLDQDADESPDPVRVMAQTTIGCFAPCPDAPGAYIPGYLTVNYLLKLATFSDFAAKARARRLGLILRAPVLAGMLGVLAVVIAFIIEIDPPPGSGGLTDNGLFRFGLIAVAGAIAFTVLVYTVNGRSATKGWRAMVALPEPLWADLCDDYERHRAAVTALKDEHAGPGSLHGAVGRTMADNAIEGVAGAVMPAGLAKLAAHLTSDAMHGEPGEADVGRAKGEAIGDMLSALLRAYRRTTGRTPLRLSNAAFEEIESVSAQELTALAE